MKNPMLMTMLSMQNERKPKSGMLVLDLLTLAAAGKAILNTNKELKGDARRRLRTAVNRAMKHVESL